MLRFALKNMWIKKGKLLLAALSVTLSAGVALLSYNISRQVQEGIVNTAAYYDIIIGPAGSSTQLAMNTLFFTDSPLGTIPYSYVEELRKNPDVNAAVPFTMGDSFNSARIVGTTPDFLDGKPLSEGVLFSDVYECVVGSAVASQYGLHIGSEIVTSHGLSSQGTKHAAAPLTVCGILDTTHTAYDNAVFTSYKTVWAVHGTEEEEEDGHSHEEATSEAAPASNSHAHHAQTDTEEHEHASEGGVCAILVKTKSFNAYYSVSGYYGENSDLLVINPATVLREVLSNVDLSSNIVYVLCGIILIMNLFVIWVITLMNLYDARKEIGLMRLIGIGMGKISLLYFMENAIAGLFSVGCALLVSRLCMALGSRFVASMGIVLNAGAFYPAELAILAAVWLISVLPTLISTARMARKDNLGGT